jgi:hypothetical protein
MQSPFGKDLSPDHGFLSLNGFEKLGLKPCQPAFSIVKKSFLMSQNANTFDLALNHPS